MNLKFTEEDEKFRQEVKDFIKENRPEGMSGRGALLGGEQARKALKKWHRILHKRGWIGLTWPKKYGGAEFTLLQQVIFKEELAKAGLQKHANGLAIDMCGPAIIKHGTEKQKDRYLPKMLSCEELWCLGLSEPNAGSDLANVKTKAVEKDGFFIINGQKIWTSAADMADYCLLLTKTDPDAPNHDSLSDLIVDMKSPGIEVKPIRQITGGADFCEIFFEDVKVPLENLVGERNKGWKIAMTTLAHERSGIGEAVGFRRTLKRIMDLARNTIRDGKPVSKDPIIRQKLAQLHMDVEAMALTGLRSLTSQLKGEDPGPTANVQKLFTTEMFQRMSEVAMEIQGPYGQLWTKTPHVPDFGMWQMAYIGGRCYTIAGGTSEIQRNVIAEKALGLPSWKNKGEKGA